MAGLLDLFGGPQTDPGALYGGLLTPDQSQALGYRGLLGFDAGLGQSMAPGSFARGAAAGFQNMLGQQDVGARNAMNARLVALQGLQIQSLLNARAAAIPALQQLLGSAAPGGAAPSGLLGPVAPGTAPSSTGNNYTAIAKDTAPAGGILGGDVNNPGNIRVPGSPGADPSAFQSFSTPQAGVDAIGAQLVAYQDNHGINTLRGMISRWAPPNENPTPQLIANASARTGFSPEQKLDMHDPAQRLAMTKAIVAQEGKSPALAEGTAPGTPQGPMPQGLLPSFAGADPNFPMRAAATGAMMEAAGLPNIGAPFLQAYQMSPAYQAQIAAAKGYGALGPDLYKAWHSPMDVRVNGLIGDPSTGRIVLRNPAVAEGYTVENGPNGMPRAVEVPNALAGIAKSAAAKAGGEAQFEPQTYRGPYGQEFQGTRAGLPQMSAGGFTPQLQPTPPPASPPNQRIEAAGPTFPVQTPGGTKDLSQLSVTDLFPGGRGIPQPPQPPAGMGYGEPSKALEEGQKEDAERLGTYQQEASQNPKIYQDLAHLRDVLGQSLSTSKLAPFASDIGNIAQGLGLGNLVPDKWNPANSAEFDKVATDLVFGAVKKLNGQVKVAEIEGYKRANPNLTLPRATNYNIMNDLLAQGKWQDARARLATDYMTQTGGAPLAAFDARFNSMAPLPDVTDQYKAALRAQGATFPEDTLKGGASAAQPAVPRTATLNGKSYINIGGQWFAQ